MKRPYITIKFAQTLDGKIAAADGSSRWISSLEARKFAHKLRAANDAILVGIGTILKDDPLLTTRLVRGKSPAKIIIDSSLRIPLKARVLRNTKHIRTIIVTTKNAPKQKAEKLIRKGAEVIISASLKAGNIDLESILRILYKKNIRRVLVEGGKGIITSLLKDGLFNKLVVIIAPKILGKGIDSIGYLGIKNIKHALRVKAGGIKYIGEDIIYTAYRK